MTDPDKLLALYHHIAPRIPRAIQNAGTWRDGYPTGGTGGGSGESRTETLASRHVDRGDPHGDLLRDLERHLMALVSLVERAAPSNKAQDHLASKTPDAVRAPDDCESCWRDGGYRTRTRTPGSKLCRWCEDMARDLKLPMPPLMLVEYRHQGKRITDRDVRLATGGKR